MHKTTSIADAPPTETADWRACLRRIVRQEPLIDTKFSLAGLERLGAKRHPTAVFVGIGLCRDDQLGHGLPLDLLGLLLPAEQVRRAIGAETLQLLVADEHALDNGVNQAALRQLTWDTMRVLARLKRSCFGETMRIVPASSFHDDAAYREILSMVQRRAPSDEHHYFIKEAADIEYLHRQLGGVLKVGWTVGGEAPFDQRQDELAFDERFRRWLGEHVGFVYCKAGRVLDVRRPKASPYLLLDAEHRLCLRADEDPDRLGQIAAECGTRRGTRNHLKAITRAFSQVVTPLQGPLEDRLQQLYAHIFPTGAEQDTKTPRPVVEAPRCPVAV